MQSLPSAAIREIDRRAIEEYGISGIVLMENAGRGCADKICELDVEGPVVICCGRGNNSGDGLVIARHLDLRGYQVEVLLFCDPQELRGDALTNYEIVRCSQIPLTICSDQSASEPSWLSVVVAKLQAAGLLIDALLGTGTIGKPRHPLNLVINAMNESGWPIIAIDLPSGLDAATGIPSSATIRATQTLTFVAPKTGFANPAAKSCLGTVHVLDIGAPRVLVEAIMRENAP